MNDTITPPPLQIAKVGVVAFYDKEIRSMLLLDDNSVTLSSVSSAALSKREGAYMEPEDNDE